MPREFWPSAVICIFAVNSKQQQTHNYYFKVSYDEEYEVKTKQKHEEKKNAQ